MYEWMATVNDKKGARIDLLAYSSLVFPEDDQVSIYSSARKHLDCPTRLTHVGIYIYICVCVCV